MSVINYLIGDATRPVGDGQKIIPHVCNDVKAWGSGFVLAISKRWKEPERVFRSKKMQLGEVDFIRVEDDIVVANMCAQTGIRPQNGIPPIRMHALRTCLQKVVEEALKMRASIHMPRIGAHRAGGKWPEIEKVIIEELINRNIKVFVYDLSLADRKRFEQQR